MPAITSLDLENAKTDVDHLAAIANSTDLTATDRLGRTKRTLAGLSAEFPNAAANAAAAAASATQAVNEATSAATAVDLAFAEATAAQASRVAAEAARDAAQLSAGVYATTAEGLAATTNGAYFSVPSANSAEYLILYKNNAGSAESIKTYPSVSIVQQVLDYFSISEQSNAVEFRDPNGVFSVAISKLGVLLANSALFNSLEIGELRVVAGDYDTSLLEIADEAGNTVFRVRKNGKIEMKPISDLQASVTDLQDQIDQINLVAPDGLANLTKKAWSALAFATEANGSVNVIGDSISVGVGASNQATTSWWARLRSAILGANGENLGGITSVPHLTFYNRAVSGVTSSYFNNTSRLSTITTNGGVGLYIVALGTNNIYNASAHTLPSVYESDLNAIVDYIQAANPANRVMLVVPPIANETTWAPYQDHSKYAAACRRVARAKGCVICDDRGTEMVAAGYYGDGVHPNDAGHEALFLNRLKSIINL